MRILRLGNSMDVISTVPDERRVYRLVEAAFAERTGEPLETVLRRIDPRPALPAIIDRWVRETRPDVAMLLVNQYWYGFPSAPERMEQLGRVGRILAKLSYKAAHTPWIAHNPAYRGLRSLARRLIGTTYMHEPEEVVEVMRACIDLFVERHPGVPLGVWSEPVPVVHDLDPKLEPELQARRARVHGPLREYCTERGVAHYLHLEPQTPFDWKRFRDKDHMHLNEAGHAWVAGTQIDLVVELWERRPRPSAAAPTS